VREAIYSEIKAFDLPDRIAVRLAKGDEVEGVKGTEAGEHLNENMLDWFSLGGVW